MAKHFQTPVTINNILYAQSTHNMGDRWMDTCYFLYMDFALTHLMKVIPYAYMHCDEMTQMS